VHAVAYVRHTFWLHTAMPKRLCCDSRCCLHACPLLPSLTLTPRTIPDPPPPPAPAPAAVLLKRYPPWTLYRTMPPSCMSPGGALLPLCGNPWACCWLTQHTAYVPPPCCQQHLHLVLALAPPQTPAAAVVPTPHLMQQQQQRRRQRMVAGRGGWQQQQQQQRLQGYCRHQQPQHMRPGVSLLGVTGWCIIRGGCTTTAAQGACCKGLPNSSTMCSGLTTLP
jgi:hypothetical protein